MGDWKSDLAGFYQGLEGKATQTAQQQEQERSVVLGFFSNVVAPAFGELKTGFEQLGRRVETAVEADSASIVLYNGDDLEYEMSLRTAGNNVYPVIPLNIIRGQSIGESVRFKKSFKEMTKDDLVESFLNAYKNFISRRAG